jgi:hypothetical protein
MFFLLACLSSDKIDHSQKGLPEEKIQRLSSNPSWVSVEQAYSTGGVVVDIDNDGDSDVVVSEGNDMEQGHIRIYRNNLGVLEEEGSWISDENHYFGHISAGDINKDGWVDIVVSKYIGDSGFSEAGGVDLYLNEEGNLSLQPVWSFEGVYTFSNALGDIDSDGDLDLLVAVGESYFQDPDRSLLFENIDGDFGEEAIWEMANPTYALDCIFLDADSDDDLDVAFANQSGGHQIYENEEGGLRTEPMWESSGFNTEGNSMDIADVNDDGYIDLLISDNDQQGGIGKVSLFCGPHFEMCWQSEDPSRMQSSVSIFDVDSDGDLDVLSGAWWGELLWYEQVDGQLDPYAVWGSGSTQQVMEAFAWIDVDQSSLVTEVISFQGLYFLPQNSTFSEEVVVRSERYIFSDELVNIEITYPYAPDLLITDWEPDFGNIILPRE